MTRSTRFVALWTLAVVATASAFVLYLALRSRAVELGYALGRARSKQAQLRETRRVLQVEAVAYRNPARIESVSKGVLQMEDPPPQRIFVLGSPLDAVDAVPSSRVAPTTPSPSAPPPAAASAAPSAGGRP